MAAVDSGVGADPEPSHAILLHDRASEWLGIEVLEVADGHAVITMTLREEMMNGFGSTHGGMIFAFADSAFAMACNPPDGDGDGDGDSVTVASGVDINFLAPTHTGQRITAVATLRQQQGRSGLYDVQVFTGGPDSPTVVAEFRGRSRTIPKKLPH